MHLGFKVASIDTDSRQQSLTHYFENRKRTNSFKETSLLMPNHYAIEMPQERFDLTSQEERYFEEAFKEKYEELKQDNDFLIIDTPGSDNYLTRIAHSYADTVVTPINDSFIDLDMLARLNPETKEIIKPSVYSEMLWGQKMVRARREYSQDFKVDWIVMRNRLSQVSAKNKERVQEVLLKIADRLSFRTINGFSERVIFRELFLQGLTLLDVMEDKLGIKLSMSHIAARREVMFLLSSLNIDIVNQKLEEGKTANVQKTKELVH